ncbi:hypothetical protein DOTSEDRAFT_75396 [Dothistroma septosporum NZE10]|uniref:Uncharacterized protein n=1 Tax=Dothistroma septosporum (strain NZE10 / CBS 128990) TaxID=675120 RepID=M2WHX6_DOTSN|nr:hypothetical protein DOTSEDRAFT_75396 [Dothistroma septosporum NZE10]
MSTSQGLLSLPNDVLVLLPDFLHNVEDYTNLSSSSCRLRRCMHHTSPNTILRLAEAQSKIFFRPSPHFLVAATARELGNWARMSKTNEHQLAAICLKGIDGLLELALEHCGLTMDRIRQMHQMRFDLFNPITDIVDKCVGEQWTALPDFWNGGVDDSYTISSEPSDTLFHLVIYGELFGPDFDAVLNQETGVPKLSVDTRLEFMKYCLPDFAVEAGHGRVRDGSVDSRRVVQPVGPYAPDEDGETPHHLNNNLALTWLIRSSRWRPHWKEARALAGEDFQDDFDDGWWYVEDSDQDWRQRMWEAVMLCQGLDGLMMMRPGLRDRWVPKMKEWKEQISKLEREPAAVKVGRQATHQYPFLLGDLRICASGYVGGT